MPEHVNRGPVYGEVRLTDGSENEAHWAKLACPAANQLAVGNADLRLDTGRELRLTPAANGPEIAVAAKLGELERAVAQLQAQVAELARQDEMNRRLEELRAELQRLQGLTPNVGAFGVSIAHSSRAGADDLPFDDAHVKDFPQTKVFGKAVLMTWILHTDHRLNHPIYQQLGYLDVRPSGNQVIISGSGAPSLTPTSFTVYVLYRE